MSEIVTLHHSGFILGIPGEHPPGMYIVEDGQIVNFSPLGAQSITVSEEAVTTISITGTDDSGDVVTEELPRRRNPVQ